MINVDSGDDASYVDKKDKCAGRHSSKNKRVSTRYEKRDKSGSRSDKRENSENRRETRSSMASEGKKPVLI